MADGPGASDDPEGSGAAFEPEPRRRRLSELLEAIAADRSRERISIGDLLAVMQDRAFGALLFIFAAPNAIPTPPGTSAILGLPLVVLAAQMALGRPTPWLPQIIASRSLARADFAAIVARVAPWLAKAERLLSPRLSFLTRYPFEQVIGVVTLLLSVILLLPIPLGNMLPAFTICVFSLAILERDGAWVIAGLGLAILSVGVVWGVVYAMVKSALYLLHKALAF